jgi:hypothetical protein
MLAISLALAAFVTAEAIVATVFMAAAGAVIAEFRPTWAQAGPVTPFAVARRTPRRVALPLGDAVGPVLQQAFSEHRARKPMVGST